MQDEAQRDEDISTTLIHTRELSDIFSLLAVEPRRALEPWQVLSLTRLNFAVISASSKAL